LQPEVDRDLAQGNTFVEQLLGIAKRILDQDVPAPGLVCSAVIPSVLRGVRARGDLLQASMLIDRHAGMVSPRPVSGDVLTSPLLPGFGAWRYQSSSPPDA